ncbi:MAG TPA: methyltransferase domain-containing protein [Acetobacteraceae bacterium]|nr:methyltransferase domain-containing protein [Acetobacteraceae bacterium]
MAQAAWDPVQYLRFAGERLRPALDLLAQVPLAAPARVTDLGCGAGNVTSVLAQRFPAAAITGIDGSEAMLAKARTAVPKARFVAADIALWEPDAPPDLIYSNAALHWVPGHAALFPRLLALLAPGGVLAVQMPAMHDAPLRRLQEEVAANGPWADHLAGSVPARPILSAGEYWDLLRPHAAALDLWETTYMHALVGDDPVVEWAAGSSLRPFLDRLPPEQVQPFRAAYAAALRPHYPRRADGTTLLPFRRLFLIARAAARG